MTLGIGDGTDDGFMLGVGDGTEDGTDEGLPVTIWRERICSLREINDITLLSSCLTSLENSF